MRIGKFVTYALYGFLAILSFTGCISVVTGFFLISPAREITAVLESRAEDYRVAVDSAERTLEDLRADSIFSTHCHLFEPLSESLSFSIFAVSAASVAVHVVNIYLILSKPVGGVLLGLLFILLGIVGFVSRDRRLRNTAMALGTAAWVFMIAVPVGVIISGQLTRIYTSGLRYAAENRLQNFSEEGSRFTTEGLLTEDPRREAVLLVKGLPNYVWFASASWLFDLVLMPVFLSWVLYRLGVFLANTLFGSFRIQKIGETLKRVFSQEG